MISCVFDLTKSKGYKSIRVLLVWMVDTLGPRERLCTLVAGLSSQGTVTVDAIVEAAAAGELRQTFNTNSQLMN